MSRLSARPLSALLSLSCSALGLTQGSFGELLGVSRTTMCRWCGGRATGLSTDELVTLTTALMPVDAALAAEVASSQGETLQSLGVVPEIVAPKVPVEHLVDSVVCAAADAVAQPPANLRPSLQAAFERAQAVGLSVGDVVAAFRRVKGSAAARSSGA